MEGQQQILSDEIKQIAEEEHKLQAQLHSLHEQKLKLLWKSSLNNKKSFQTLKNEIEDLHLDRTKVTGMSDGIKNLVFEGGGIRGIAFGGSMRFMEEYNLLAHIDGIAGSSAGAIVAAGVAVGYTSQEIIDVLSNTDFTSFRDDSWGIVFDIIRLFTQYGIYKGDAFYKWFSTLLEKKTGNANITFKEVFERYGKHLVITGTCLNKATTYYFHHEDEQYADMPVALAVRISMSIPLYWKAVKLNGDTMVDGGVLNNYPVWVFDGKYIGDPDVTDYKINQTKTLGFKLMTEGERPDSTLYHVNEKIDGPVDYGKAFLNAVLIQVERGHIRDGYWKRTVCINTHDISSLDFSLSPEKKMSLVHEGYIAAKNYFYCCIEGKENELNRAITMFQG